MTARSRPTPRPPRARELVARLRALGHPARAAFALRYFKTAPGEYGAHDRFLGIRAAVIHAEVRAARGITLDEQVKLLASPWHEARLVALLCMVQGYARGDAEERAATHAAYLANLSRISNWDLVDCSAPHVVGRHLLDRSRAPLDRLVRSPVLWERRVAIVATQAFIRAGEVAPTLRLAGRVLGDPEDLIHKASGWMLREALQRDPPAVRAFLDTHAGTMPRTMLRYAIERLPPTVRARYLAVRGAARRPVAS